MAFVIAQYINRLVSTRDIFYHDVPSINITAKNGRIYTMIAFTINHNNTWICGIPYSGTRVATDSDVNNFLDTAQYLGARILRNTAVQYTATSGVSIDSGYSLYNSDKQIGLLVMRAADQDGNNRSFWSPYNSIWQYASDAQCFLTYVGDSTDADFWDKVESGAGGRLPWQEDTSTEGGGNGDWDDDESDRVTLPSVTNLNANSILATKMMTVYRMSENRLTQLSSALWSSNIFDQISNTVLKPQDFILSLTKIPVNVPASETVLIKCGFFLLNGATGGLVTRQYHRLNCGSVDVPLKWGAAIDYTTEISIFLPFIGERKLDAHDVLGATLTVDYTIDVMTGACVASIRVQRDYLDAYLYHFEGNCACSYPVTSADFTTMFSSILSGGMAAAGAAATGGASAALAAGMESAASNLLAGRLTPNAQRSGSLNSVHGYMQPRKPYLILSRPIQSLPADFGKYKGYTSNVTMRLGDCRGYTEVGALHLDGFPATAEEKAEIESLLHGGVIFA